MLGGHLDGWLPADTRLLFVENVGNLVCPASYDLGETLRIVLASVTEGEDKPLKYPTAFGLAHLVVVTKTDIAEAVDFDETAFRANVATGQPRRRDRPHLGAAGRGRRRAARPGARGARRRAGAPPRHGPAVPPAARRRQPHPRGGHTHADGSAHDHIHAHEPHTHPRHTHGAARSHADGPGSVESSR